MARDGANSRAREQGGADGHVDEAPLGELAPVGVIHAVEITRSGGAQRRFAGREPGGRRLLHVVVDEEDVDLGGAQRCQRGVGALDGPVRLPELLAELLDGGDGVLGGRRRDEPGDDGAGLVGRAVDRPPALGDVETRPDPLGECPSQDADGVLVAGDDDEAASTRSIRTTTWLGTSSRQATKGVSVGAADQRATSRRRGSRW